MTKSIGILSVLLSLLLSVLAFGQSGTDKVQTTALADVSAIQAGKPFWIGIKFTIEPGWHIYWKNPGDSGLATEVRLKLPDGFRAGALQFPLPQRLVQTGDVVNFGYENEVTLMVQITPPRDLPSGDSVKIGAKATWLVCKEDCMPGGRDVSLELPVAAVAVPANEVQFKDWSSKLPVKNDVTDVASITTTDSIRDGNGTGSIKITWKKTPSGIQFIPGTMETGDLSDIKVVTEGAATSITFTVKNTKETGLITGLVEFTKSDGSQAGLDISIPSKVPNLTNPPDGK
jgi:DsbC/DsbD-like thiol-disulfide interchange protein